MRFPPILPFPRKRESRGAASSATHRRQATLRFRCRGNFPLAREEIPACAGMEEGGGNERRGGGLEGEGMEKGGIWRVENVDIFYTFDIIFRTKLGFCGKIAPVFIKKWPCYKGGFG